MMKIDIKYFSTDMRKIVYSKTQQKYINKSHHSVCIFRNAVYNLSLATLNVQHVSVYF